MDGTLLTALALIPALIFAIVFHEVAHGWTALMLGDPTAKERRRLSLNPLRHVDLFGTLVLPGMLALAGLPVFGWAKPVPVVQQRLRNPRFGMMAVAAAGPLTNLVMAGLASLALGWLLGAIGASPAAVLHQFAESDTTLVPTSLAGFVVVMLAFFILLNVFLALFNLLPIPPFDGSHIVEGLLPPAAGRAYARLRPYGFLLLFAVLLVIPWLFPSLNIIQRFLLPPVEWTEDKFFALAQWAAGG